jgi:hypothetical protein
MTENYKQYTGKVKIWKLFDNTRELHQENNNLVVYTAADVLAGLISGDESYKISGMYLDFKNLTSSGDPVPTTTPTLATKALDLRSVSNPLDIMRFALVSSPSLESTDSAKYEKNSVTFFGATSGSLGYNGRTFSSSVNSAAYGAGLVAMPDFNDATQDILFARVALSKLLVVTGMRIGVEWQINFG